jgi:broad specificity phosphatase PhoE
MQPRYHLKLMFEWRGGCLWAANDAALKAFDVGEIEDELPLTDETRQRLEELSVWHDTALDWDDPGGPSPWSAEEYERFVRAAREVLERVRAELGPEFSVEYRG